MEIKQKVLDIADWIVERQKLGLIVWLILIVFGTLSYSFFLNREGFPSIQFPAGLVQGTYLAGDKEQIDAEITQPISERLLEDEMVESVESVAGFNYFTVFATYKQDLSTAEASSRFESTIKDSDLLPETAQAQFIEIDPSAYLGEYNILLTVYSNESSSYLQEDAERLATDIEDALGENLDDAVVIEQIRELTNPQNGTIEQLKTSFSSYAEREDGRLIQYNSVLVGLKADSEFDVINFSDKVNSFVNEYNQQNQTQVAVGGDFAPSIKQQISSLQNNVVTGLLVVVILSFLLISWRSSIVTALFIASVLLATFIVMLAVGVTINTISLFALVLALGLFVDDATIVVEAIEANRKEKNPIREALKKVSTASIAGTLTTVLVFLPLTFVGGVLGDFIRVMPLTLIIALLTSLLLSLTLIPLLASKIVIGQAKVISPLAKIEEKLSDALSDLVAKVKNKNGLLLALGMVTLSLVMVLGSFYYFSQLKFNIFPSAKDAEELVVTINYLPGTTIEQAESIAREVNAEINEIAGDSYVRSLYYDANTRSATSIVELTSFSEREQSAIEIMERFDNFADSYRKADLFVIQLDPGPPEARYPFRVQIYGEEDRAIELAREINRRLSGSSIQLSTGTAVITDTKITGIDTVQRKDGERFVQVEAGYNSDEVSALVRNTTDVVKTNFSDLAEQQGLELGFDLGQETQNQESFNSLLLVGPLALLAMYALLAVQFKSILMPLLIFLAIPFSFFGVAAGLYYTDNPISFFTLVGFLGLIGIAVNNTILLTDYANQELSDGEPLLKAVANATKKRFRPLITTSFTTVAALLPLALSDPFWEALAFTIIFGLLSSTLLVVLSFPYYYLLAQKLRAKFSKKKESV